MIHPGNQVLHVPLSVAVVLSVHYLLTHAVVSVALAEFEQYADEYPLHVSAVPVNFEQSVGRIHASFLLLIHPFNAVSQFASVA